MSLGILLVDPQYDFFPGGALGVTGGEKIVDPINRALARHAAAPLFVTRCWHPAQSAHFESGGGTWPPHCVQGTKGAELHADLQLGDRARLYEKGTDPQDDAGYSGFEGRAVEGGTLLEDDLRAAGVDTLLVAGLATDYCVKETVVDAQQRGFTCFVLQAGIRPVELQSGDGQKALDAMTGAGAYLVSA